MSKLIVLHITSNAIVLPLSSPLLIAEIDNIKSVNRTWRDSDPYALADDQSKELRIIDEASLLPATPVEEQREKDMANLRRQWNTAYQETTKLKAELAEAKAALEKFKQAVGAA